MQLKVNDQLPISIQAADEFGNPTTANFDSPPSWSSANGSSVVAPSADGLSANITSAKGALTSDTVQVSGTVGGVAVVGSLPIQWVAGDTAEIVLQPGTPVAVPAPAPAASQPASS